MQRKGLNLENSNSLAMQLTFCVFLLFALVTSVIIIARAG